MIIVRFQLNSYGLQLLTVNLHHFSVVVVIVFAAIYIFPACCCYCRRHQVCSTYSLCLLVQLYISINVVIVAVTAFTIIVIVVLGLFLIRLRDFVIVAAQSLLAGKKRCIICNMQHWHYTPTKTIIITRAQLLHPLVVCKLDFDKAVVVWNLAKLN